MKILTVVGARPQFVKAAVLSRAIQDHPALEEVLVHTGQHFDQNMSQVFFDEMSIPQPDYQLEMGGMLHGEMTGRMLIGLEPIVIKEKPDVLLVYGDTNSTLAGALVAAKLGIPIAHIEAGLRSFNLSMPEEVNRILTDRVSEWLFCPSVTAEKNLINEGFSEKSIFNVGDIMLDATLFYSQSLKPSKSISNYVSKYSKYSLCTVHRAENTDDLDRLKKIFSALSEASEKSPVIMPLHPRTKSVLDKNNISTGKISIVEPVSYGDMLFLLKNSQGIVTDSGGLQKEAYFLSKPCYTLRSETEWVETIEAGVNQLLGDDFSEIETAISGFGEKDYDFSKAYYGSGHAGDSILKHLVGGQ